MSEPVNDPLADQLRHLQPGTGGFDRDALLFAAGRESARSRRIWPALAATLAATQALMLAVYFSRPPEPQFCPVIVVTLPGPSAAEQPAALVPAEVSPYGRALAAADPSLLPPNEISSSTGPAEPLWTVRSFGPASLID